MMILCFARHADLCGSSSYVGVVFTKLGFVCRKAEQPGRPRLSLGLGAWVGRAEKNLLATRGLARTATAFSPKL